MPVDHLEVERRQRFDAFYAARYREIFAYVHRRLTPGGAEVSDVVAEIFAVAWRRIDEIPPVPEDRLWLYGVAHRCALRARRTDWRRMRLQARLIDDARRGGPAAPETFDLEPERVRNAIAGLRPTDREVLMLVCWEQLSHAEAATVLGCSSNAIALRLRRAKQRLRHQLKTPAGESRSSVPEPEAHS